MTPGFCGFFEKPDWVDDAEGQHYCKVIPTEDGDAACFVEDNGIADESWIESGLTIPLGDAR